MSSRFQQGRYHSLDRAALANDEPATILEGTLLSSLTAHEEPVHQRQRSEEKEKARRRHHSTARSILLPPTIEDRGTEGVTSWRSFGLDTQQRAHEAHAETVGHTQAGCSFVDIRQGRAVRE